jgi:glutaredoxin
MMRCATHGIALRHDGECLLCMRSGEKAVQRRTRALLVVLSVIVLGLALVAVVAKTAIDALRVASVETTSADVAAAPRVKVFTTKWCPVCKTARAWLDDQKIEWVERDVEKDPEAAAEFRKLGGRVVPTFVIDGEVKTGFDPTWVKHAVEKAERSPAT